MEAKLQHAQSSVQTAQKILKYTYGLVPIIAGLDKFFNLLTDWKTYLPGAVSDHLPFSAGTFMAIAGVIEMAAGLLVFIRTRAGAWLVMVWLIAIAFTLVLGGHFLDVAVRDLVMAVGALVLAILSGKNESAREYSQTS